MSSPGSELHLSESRLRRRYLAERAFRSCGALAVGTAVLALGFLFASMLWTGYSGFTVHKVRLDVSLDPDVLGLSEGYTDQELGLANFAAPIRRALEEQFPEVEGRRALRELRELVSRGAQFELRERVLQNPSWLGTEQPRPVWLTLDDQVDLLLKGSVRRDLPEDERVLSDAQLEWLDTLQARGRIDHVLSWSFFTSGDSREPELAGLGGALVGSILTLLLTAVLCVPVGVAAAVYLEEFARRSRLTHWIEVNINNLAAVPSIVFGLLGLGIFLNVFGMPRSAPAVGGLVLAVMTLPTIILASRAAIQAVPPSIRAGALALGASPMQTVAHHVLPLALPGILTGTIIGMARALGETAPLLMIGMVAFVVDVPEGFASPSTVLPVQIYLWADSPERAFQAKTGAAILVLIAFLLLMNLLAVILRRRFERRW